MICLTRKMISDDLHKMTKMALPIQLRLLSPDAHSVDAKPWFLEDIPIPYDNRMCFIEIYTVLSIHIIFHIKCQGPTSTGFFS